MASSDTISGGSGDVRMHKVESSMIKLIGYSDEHQLLRVKFNDNSVYQYVNVPREVYDNLLNAESIGRFFNQNVKGVYNGFRVTKIRRTSK